MKVWTQEENSTFQVYISINKMQIFVNLFIKLGRLRVLTVLIDIVCPIWMHLRSGQQMKALEITKTVCVIILKFRNLASPVQLQGNKCKLPGNLMLTSCCWLLIWLSLRLFKIFLLVCNCELCLIGNSWPFPDR